MTFTYELDVTEVEDYAKQLRIHAGEGARAFAPTAAKYQGLVIKEAKRIVPIDTGNLFDSILPGPRLSSQIVASADIVVDATYAGFVEFGTVRMAPQPYIRPALRKYRKPYEDELAQVAKSELGVLKGGTRRVLRGVRRFGE